MPSALTRRDFLQRGVLSAGAVGFPLVLPTRVLGREGSVPPNGQVTLGVIGVGAMGTKHIEHFLPRARVRILAVCDVYGPHLDRAKGLVGADCAAYKDYRDLLDRDDIDAVVIATPDHWHSLIAVHACEAGKDVYCEKPLTLTIAEGRHLVDAVRRYGRVFQVGSQQRSDENFRHACELVRNGRIGKLLTVKTNLGQGPTSDWQPDEEPPPELDWNMWLGPAPWAPYNPQRCIHSFRWFFDYSGGKLTDWGAHHNDIAQWGIGADDMGPVSVEGSGGRPTRGLYETYVWYNLTYNYANGVILSCSTDNPRGVYFEGTNGWVHVDRRYLKVSDEALLNEKFGADEVRLYESSNHRDNWLDSIATRAKPVCDVEIGHRSITVCHLGNIALRLGRKLEWDPMKERFVNDEEADRWLEKPYRAPWHL